MRHSVFWKIIIAVCLLTITAEVGMLFFLYRNTYNLTVKDATAHIKYAASSAARALETYDPYDLNDFKQGEKVLNEICNGLDITYLYAIRPDFENKDELYLATAWGKNASPEFTENRYSGYVAKGMLHPEQIRAFQGEKEVLIHETNQYDDTLICYTPIERYFSDTHVMYINKIASIVCAEVSLTSVMEEFDSRYRQLLFVILAVTVLILGSTGILLYFRISKPLRLISRRMKGFISQKGEFFEKLPVKGKDEIAEMSDSFNTMAEEIDSFIAKMTELNRQKAELSLARKIQRGLLEPQAFSNGAVSIRASMLTAKDVGGDLYDYRVLENGDIFVAIADVSGKGITASLFMARAITLLSQYAGLGYSPGKILHEYNNSLAGHNSNRMFITTFAAVYRPQTGELVYANAGHNYPYILSDSLITLNEKHGVAAGVFKNVQYPEYSAKMKAGDRLFLFTDGVTEAENKEGGFFGEEKLEAVLQVHRDGGAEELVNAVTDEINSFVHGAVQSDDITMLALEVLKEE